MSQQFLRITARYKGDRYFGYRDPVKGSIQADIPVDLIKILYREMVVGAFVFLQIFNSEHSGDVFLYGDVFEFLDDDKIDPERFTGKLKLGYKFKNIAILFKLKLESLDTSGMPQGMGFFNMPSVVDSQNTPSRL
jgi:hypothetical protein